MDANQPTPPEAEPNLVLPIPEVDWHLRSLVELANKLNFEVGVTLVVSGMLVTGTLIGGKAYFERFAADISEGMGRALGPENVAGIYESYAAPAQMYEGGDEDTTPPAGYIHLKGARFFVGGNPIPGSGALWRGRLSAVSGFSLGELQVG